MSPEAEEDFDNLAGTVGTAGTATPLNAHSELSSRVSAESAI
jgi:hypothetical protein